MNLKSVILVIFVSSLIVASTQSPNATLTQLLMNGSIKNLTIDTNSANSSKSLEILHLKSPNNPIKYLSNPDLPANISDFKFLFLIVIEVSGKIGKFSKPDVTKIERNFNIKRPLLISLINNSSEIHYEMNGGRMSESLSVTRFLSLLTDKRDALNFAVRKNCALCLRLAKVIDEKYEKNVNFAMEDRGKCDIDCVRALFKLPVDDELTKIPESTFILLHQAYVVGFKAYGNSVVKLRNQNYTVEEITEVVDITMDLEGLASMAWRQREFKVFEFLIRADFPFPEEFISDRARNDTRYPLRNKFVKKVEEHLIEIQEFHDDIRGGNAEKVKKFLSTHPLLHFARNIDNRTALHAAFESSQLEIQALLKGHGMSVGSIDELIAQRSSVDDFSDETKAKIRQLNHDFTVPVEEDYISRLLHRTSLYFDQSTFVKRKLVIEVQKAYKEINAAFPEILKIISTSDQLEVIFNFESDQIDDFDPSGHAVGIMSPQLTYVIIGSSDLLSNKAADRNYVLGTIAHEFMHLAMHIIYENSGDPYAKNDSVRIEKFRDVTKSCEAKKDAESSISSAFTYDDEDGEGDGFHSELIARVPDMLLSYKHDEEHISKIKQTFNELFDFYYNETLPDMLEILPVIATIQKVREFNQWFDLHDGIEAFGLNICNNFTKNSSNHLKTVINSLSLDPAHKIHAILSNAPSAALIKLNQEAKSAKIPAVFTSLSFGGFDNFHKAIYDIDSLKTELILVVYCDDFLFLPTFMAMIEQSSIEHVIFVTAEEFKDQFAQFDELEVTSLTITLGDFCEESKEKILDMKVAIQGFDVELRSAVEGFDDLSFLPIQEIITETDNPIGNDLDENKEYFLSLKVVDSKGDFKDLDEILEDCLDGRSGGLLDSNDSRENEIDDRFKRADLRKKNEVTGQRKTDKVRGKYQSKKNNRERQSLKTSNATNASPSRTSTVRSNLLFLQHVKNSSKVHILSSPPGSGKSVMLKEIANKIKALNPSHWVIYVKLYEFDEFFSTQSDGIVEFLCQFAGSEASFLKNYLQNSPSRVAILLDEFDTLKNPENAANLIARFREFSHHLWIATRPHHEDLIKKTLKPDDVYEIAPLDHKDRSTYLEYFSHLSEPQEADLEKFLEDNKIDNVQLMRGIVELWNESNGNLYSLFSKLLSTRFRDFAVPEYDDLQLILNLNLNIFKSLQQTAIKTLPFLDSSLTKHISSVKSLNANFSFVSDEILLDFGLIYKQKSDKKFIHKVIQQFLIVQFLFENLNSDLAIEKLLEELLKRKNKENFTLIYRILKDCVAVRDNEKLKKMLA